MTIINLFEQWLAKQVSVPPRPGLTFNRQSHRWERPKPYYSSSERLDDQKREAQQDGGRQGSPSKIKKLVTTPHLWQRAQTRVGFQAVHQGLDSLKDVDLPKDGWYKHIVNDGYIVGHGNVVKTVLSPTMHPMGKRI